MTSPQTKPHKKYEGDVYQKGLVYEIGGGTSSPSTSDKLPNPILVQETSKDAHGTLPTIESKQDPAASDVQKEQEERNEQEKIYKLLLKLQKPQLKELIREMVKVDPKKFEHIKHYVENYERIRSQSNKKDWNKDFQTLLAEPDTEQKFRKLFHLAHDFVYAAGTYAKIIISELALPPEEKTIEAVDIGGMAGGTKYICQNILFKFALDFEIRPGLWMYGGDVRSDENAMKAAAHELKGLISYYSCNIEGLHFPLMALIDYKGFRVIAISILPINDNTICYGSSDAGNTIHCDISELNEKMDKAAAILNLKKHVVGKKGTKLIRLSSPGDLEGHLGTDGKFYLLDFARTFPPEGPDLDEKKREKRQVYYKLLRPEFVRQWKTPLCSDAFTNWQKYDPERLENNLEIMKATRYLLTKVVSDFAEKLDSFPQEITPTKSSFLENRAIFARKFARIHNQQYDSSQDLERKRSHRIDITYIIQELHRSGLNIRHLGHVRSKAKSFQMRKLLLLEMIARVIKDILRAQMRAKMREVKVLSEEPFKEVVTKVFSLILGRSEKSEKFWSLVKARLVKKFHNALSKEEEEEQGSLQDKIDIGFLFTRLQELVGVRLTQEARQELEEFPESFEFVDSDVAEVYAKVKHMNIIDYAEGMALSLMAKNTDGRRERLRLLKLSSLKFASALRALPDSFMTLCQWGSVLVEEAKMSSSLKAQQCLESACEKFREAVSINPKFQTGYLKLGDALIDLAKISTSREASNHESKQLYRQAAAAYEKALALDDSIVESVYRRIQNLTVETAAEDIPQKRRKLLHYGITKLCAVLYETLKLNRERSNRDPARKILTSSRGNLPPLTIKLKSADQASTYSENNEPKRILTRLEKSVEHSQQLLQNLVLSTSPPTTNSSNLGPSCAKEAPLRSPLVSSIPKEPFPQKKPSSSPPLGPSFERLRRSVSLAPLPLFRTNTSNTATSSSTKIPKFSPQPLQKVNENLQQQMTSTLSLNNNNTLPSSSFPNIPSPQEQQDKYLSFPTASRTQAISIKTKSSGTSGVDTSPLSSEFQSPSSKGDFFNHYEIDTSSFIGNNASNTRSLIEKFLAESTPSVDNNQTSNNINNTNNNNTNSNITSKNVFSLARSMSSYSSSDEKSDMSSPKSSGEIGMDFRSSGNRIILSTSRSRPTTPPPSQTLSSLCSPRISPNIPRRKSSLPLPRKENNYALPEDFNLKETNTPYNTNTSFLKNNNLSTSLSSIGTTTTTTTQLNSSTLLRRQTSTQQSQELSRSTLSTSSNTYYLDTTTSNPSQVQEEDELSALFREDLKSSTNRNITNNSNDFVRRQSSWSEGSSSSNFSSHLLTQNKKGLETFLDKTQYFKQILPEIIYIWSDSLIQYEATKNNETKYEAGFSAAAEKLKELIELDANGLTTIQKRAVELRIAAKENQKLHFAAAELYRVLFESKRCENSVRLLFEWGNALLDYATLHCSNVSKFAEMHKSAGEKFEKVLELEPTFLDEKIRTIFTKQNRRDLDTFFYLMPFCPLLAERLEELGKDIHTLNLEGCHAITDNVLAQLAKLMPHITNINLSSCNSFTDEGLKRLSQLCRELKVVNLSSCGAIKDEGVKALCENCKELTDLNLSNTSITDNAILYIVQNTRALKRLDLERCKLISRAALTLAQYNQNPLTSLSLNRCPKIDDEAIITLCQNPAMSDLRNFDLSGCSMLTIDAISSISTKLKNLTSLSLESGYNINDECLRLLAENLKELQKICLKNTKVTSQGLVYLATLPKLHHIDLSRCPLFPPRPRPHIQLSERSTSSNNDIQPDTELDNLPPVNPNFETFFLNVGPRITSLSFAHCFTIRAQYFFIMAKYLSANIISLDLAECREITNEALISITRSTPNLENLNLDSCRNFNDYGAMQLAANCPKLKSLNLARCNITDQGVAVISKGLTKLECLNLAANFAITDKGVFAIAKNLTNLKHLNLGLCSKIKDEAILKLVENIPTLQYLNLEGCVNITNKALTDIAKHCKELETLILARCSAISDSGIEALATGVPTLCTLDLSNLNRLTDKGVIALAKYLPSIETILLQNCEKVTEAALSHIEQNKTIKSKVLPIQSQLLIKELSSQLSSPKLLLSTRAKPIAIPKPLKQPSGIPENEELRNKIAIVRQRHDSRAAKVSQEKQSQENVDISQESPQKKAPQYDPFTVKYPYEVLSARPRPPKCDPSNLEKYLTVEEFVKYFKMTPEEFERLPQWRKLKKKTDLRLF